MSATGGPRRGRWDSDEGPAMGERRMSVQGILAHPWFQTDLAHELLSMNHDLLDLPTSVRHPPRPQTKNPHARLPACSGRCALASQAALSPSNFQALGSTSQAVRPIRHPGTGPHQVSPERGRHSGDDPSRLRRLNDLQVPFVPAAVSPLLDYVPPPCFPHAFSCDPSMFRKWKRYG